MKELLPSPPPGYMYIRILLDHVTSTQPISVSVLVSVAESQMSLLAKRSPTFGKERGKPCVFSGYLIL